MIHCGVYLSEQLHEEVDVSVGCQDRLLEFIVPPQGEQCLDFSNEIPVLDKRRRWNYWRDDDLVAVLVVELFLHQDLRFLRVTKKIVYRHGVELAESHPLVQGLVVVGPVDRQEGPHERDKRQSVTKGFRDPADVHQRDLPFLRPEIGVAVHEYVAVAGADEDPTGVVIVGDLRDAVVGLDLRLDQLHVVANRLQVNVDLDAPVVRVPLGRTGRRAPAPVTQLQTLALPLVDQNQFRLL